MSDDLLRSHGPTHRDRYGTYTWKSERFRSVTTILGGTLPKPALVSWAAKCVAQHVAERARELEQKRIGGKALLRELLDADYLAKIPWQKRNAKADLGTCIHKVCEGVAAGELVNPKMFGALEGYVAAFLAWIEQMRPEYVAIEAEVFNREYGYAGTLDSIVRVGGRTLIMDYKTSADTYPDHSLQLAAYRHAQFMVVGDREIPMPATDGGAILLVHPSGCRLYEWDCGEEEFALFRSLIPIERWMKLKREARLIGTSAAATAQLQEVA